MTQVCKYGASGIRLASNAPDFSRVKDMMTEYHSSNGVPTAELVVKILSVARELRLDTLIFDALRGVGKYYVGWEDQGDQLRNLILNTKLFIETGSRRTPLETHYMLLPRHRNQYTILPDGRDKVIFKTACIEIFDRIDIIDRWLCHDGGLDDMVRTIDLLFCDAR